MDIRLNFVTARRIPPLGLALLLVAVALGGWQGWAAWQDLQALDDQMAGLASLQRPRGAARPAMTPKDVERHQQIEKVARHLAAPWPTLLDMFERHAREGVVLLKLKPEAQAGQLEVTARARGVGAAGAYLLALEREPQLGNAQLLRHEAVADDPDAFIEFVIRAEWKTGPAPLDNPSPTPVAPAKAASQ